MRRFKIKGSRRRNNAYQKKSEVRSLEKKPADDYGGTNLSPLQDFPTYSPLWAMKKKKKKREREREKGKHKNRKKNRTKQYF